MFVAECGRLKMAKVPICDCMLVSAVSTRELYTSTSGKLPEVVVVRSRKHNEGVQFVLFTIFHNMRCVGEQVKRQDWFKVFALLVDCQPAVTSCIIKCVNAITVFKSFLADVVNRPKSFDLHAFQ